MGHLCGITDPAVGHNVIAPKVRFKNYGRRAASSVRLWLAQASSRAARTSAAC
jgi:hypothetical protein